MSPRIIPGLLALALICFSGSQIGAAPSWEPRRDLTDAERLDYSVAESELVGIGQVVGVVDALVPPAGAAGGRGVGPYRYVVFQPARWLKGAEPLAPLAVGFDDPASPVFDRLREHVRADSGQVLIFLRRRAGGAPGGEPAAEPAPAKAARAKARGTRELPAPAEPAADPARLARCEWVLDESPYLYGGGVATLRPGDDEVVERTLVDAAHSRTLESLVVTANLACLGTEVGDAPCAIGGRDGRCARVHIDQMLAGSTTDAEVPVYSLLPGGVPAGQSLYFLRQTADGPYEILAFAAGVMPVRSGRVEPLGKPLADVQAAILQIVRARRGPGD
jgi:hypothetical protein